MKELTYATVCSGIECMSVACRGLPLRPVFFSEIEPFPCAVLKAHYPDVPNLGDMSKIQVTNQTEITNGTINIRLSDRLDILAGGTPCQDVSVAGKRRGMAEGSNTRSSLAFEFVRLSASSPLDTSYGRTWRGVSIPRTPQTSSDSPTRLGTAGILSRGVCLTRSMCEWTAWSVPSRRDGGVCGLSDVLEPMSPSLRKYFLSPTALSGILRRADARGKVLPTLLRDAIEWMLQWWEKQPSPSTAVKAVRLCHQKRHGPH